MDLSRLWATPAVDASGLETDRAVLSISTFEHMTEAEIEEGFARMDAHVAAEPDALPDTGESDLLVLG